MVQAREKPGSGTRYYREESPPTEQIQRAETRSVFDVLKDILNNRKLENKALRNQVALIEKQVKPKTPQNPEDVTIENVHTLSDADLYGMYPGYPGLWKDLETDQDGRAKLEAWRSALEQIVELPRLVRSEFPSDLEYRRAVVEQSLASNYSADQHGYIHNVDIQRILRELLPHGMAPEQVASVITKITTQVDTARKILTANNDTSSFNLGSQEILMDTIARSNLPLAENDPAAPPLRDRKVTELLSKVGNSIAKHESTFAKSPQASEPSAKPPRPVAPESERLADGVFSRDQGLVKNDRGLYETVYSRPTANEIARTAAELIESMGSDVKVRGPRLLDDIADGGYFDSGYLPEDTEAMLRLIESMIGTKTELERRPTRAEVIAKANELVDNVSKLPEAIREDAAEKLRESLTDLADGTEDRRTFRVGGEAVYADYFPDDLLFLSRLVKEKLSETTGT